MKTADELAIESVNGIARGLVSDYKAGRSILVKTAIVGVISRGLQFVLAAKVGSLDEAAGREVCVVIANQWLGKPEYVL